MHCAALSKILKCHCIKIYIQTFNRSNSMKQMHLNEIWIEQNNKAHFNRIKFELECQICVCINCIIF